MSGQVTAADLLHAFQSGDLVIEPPKRGEVPGMSYDEALATVRTMAEADARREKKHQADYEEAERAYYQRFWEGKSQERQGVYSIGGALRVFADASDHIRIEQGPHSITVQAADLAEFISDLQSVQRALGAETRARAYQHQRMREAMTKGAPPIARPY